MKKHGLLVMVISILLLLTSCSTTTNNFNQTQVHENLLKENWMRQVNLDPNKWVSRADAWYLTGQPNSIEQYDSTAPSAKAITTMMVRVPDFTQVNVSGDFQVQIAGRQAHNSVFVIGPNTLARQVVVEIQNNTLYVHKAKGSKECLKNVIVRINIHNLQILKNFGSSNIYGRDVVSDKLLINSYDCGNLFLSGSMNVTRINQTGTGNVVIIGADTPDLNIKVIGNGSVNISGHVGIQHIIHQGQGNINILGADSDALTIDAAGKGQTSVVGYVNLKKINAINSSRVYVYWINSNNLYINSSGNARIGLAGAVTNMNIDMTNASRFEGQYLRGTNIYVRTRDWAHANVTVDKKTFAAALGNSSIYIFGSPNMVSRYTSQNGAIIPVWTEATTPPLSPSFKPAPQRSSYKGG
jgi:hypothetical protein